MIAIGEEWDGILKAAREKVNEIEKNDMMEIIESQGYDKEQVNTVNNTLYVAMLQTTEGDAHGKVTSSGVDKALDTYRYIHHKGKNDTTQNAVRVKRRAMHPEAAVNASEVEGKLNKWKEDLRYLEETGHGKYRDDDLKTIAVGILPEDIADHILNKFNDRKTYKDLETEIMDIVNREVMKVGKKKGLNIINDKPEIAGPEGRELYYWDVCAGELCLAMPAQTRSRSDDDDDDKN